MMVLRSLAPVLLAIVMALTGITMAVARGQMAGAQSVVICSGYGIVTIQLDQRGEPIDTVHPCPDCTVVLALAPARNHVLTPALALRGTSYQTLQAQSVARIAHGLPHPRGPPAA